MLFDVYGPNALYQWIGWIAVFVCLILANEIARRSKAGGIFCFFVVPAILTAYFIAIYLCAGAGMAAQGTGRIRRRKRLTSAKTTGAHPPHLPNSSRSCLTPV